MKKKLKRKTTKYGDARFQPDSDEMFFFFFLCSVLCVTNTAFSDSFSFRPWRKPITLSQRSGRLIFGSQTFSWTFCPGKCLHVCACGMCVCMTWVKYLKKFNASASMNIQQNVYSFTNALYFYCIYTDSITVCLTGVCVCVCVTVFVLSSSDTVNISSLCHFFFFSTLGQLLFHLML